MNLNYRKSETAVKDANCMYLLYDPIIAKIFAAILVSTTAMATLEPCLPIWLMETIRPEVRITYFNLSMIGVTMCMF